MRGIQRWYREHLGPRRVDAFDLVLEEKLRRYEAPFTRANREADCRTAWAFFPVRQSQRLRYASGIYLSINRRTQHDLRITGHQSFDCYRA